MALIAIKVATATAIALVAFWFGSGNELAVGAATFFWVGLAAALLVFVRQREIKWKAAAFLVASVFIQHATDFYFWQGVQEKGFPWPWSPSANPTVGSILPQVVQVSTASSVLVTFVAAVLALWHLRGARRENAA
ncbi:MAG: hypothetical protein KIS62_07530 [Ramlibacter sp.]|nr:hypothetical protein [Ramlibacter sp.]